MKVFENHKGQFIALGVTLLAIGAGCAHPTKMINGTTSGISGSGTGSQDVAGDQPAQNPSNASPDSSSSETSSASQASNGGSVPQFGPDAAASLAPKVPTGTFVGLDGKKYDLAKLKGQVVVIDYWAPWCPPCRLGLPFTQRMADTFKGKGLTVIAATTDPKVPGAGDTLASIQQFVKTNHYSMNVALDKGAKFAQEMQITELPTTLFINKKGEVVAREVGLYPQSDSIANLQKAGLNVGSFAPQNDPTTNSQ